MDTAKCKALARWRKQRLGGIGGVAPDGQPRACLNQGTSRVAGCETGKACPARFGKPFADVLGAALDNSLPVYSSGSVGLFNRHSGYYSPMVGKSFKPIISSVKCTSYQFNKEARHQHLRRHCRMEQGLRLRSLYRYLGWNRKQCAQFFRVHEMNRGFSSPLAGAPLHTGTRRWQLIRSGFLPHRASGWR